jgi:hypothetical protein
MKLWINRVVGEIVWIIFHLKMGIFLALFKNLKYTSNRFELDAIKVAV